MKQIHLSANGSDRGNGSSERPFATPKRAQMAARKVRGPVQIIVHDGIYELAETLTFTPADSGQRWSAAAGAKPVFSGGTRLGGWTVGTHDGRTAWTLDLPAVRAGAWFFTQLWVNGQRRERPRLPKSGFFRFSGLDGQGNTGLDWGKGPDRAEYPEGSLTRFRNLADVSLVAYQLWFDTHHRIKELDEARRIVRFHVHSIGSLHDEGGQFARFVVINAGEALSEPGEWYLDRAAATVTYLPLPGETPETATVVAPRLAQLVRFQGSASAAVCDVVLEHIGFEHSEWTRALDTCGTAQAAFDVPGAIILERAERCVLYGCEVAHIAGYGIELLAGCHRNVVAASTIRDLGGGGIKVGHEDLQVHGSEVGRSFSPDPRWLRPMATTIADCHLHDGGHVYPSAIGVWIGNAGQNRVQHNHIHHFAYTGISCGWTWGYAATRTWDNRIERNHIHHINHERLLSDNGGIYSLGVQPGTTIVGNHLHDISCYHYGGWGLYPDEGSSGMQWHDNLVHHVQYCGFSVHYARFLSVKNNIFAVMEQAMLNPGRTDLGCALVFERNLTWFDRDNLRQDADWSPTLCSTRRNLVWNAGAGGVRWHRGSLAQENAAGRWLESVEADPLFVDPRSGDFALRSDSPALALGFKPFDWRKAGVRTRGTLPATWRRYTLPAAKPKALAVAAIEPGRLRFTAAGTILPLRITLRNPSAGRVRGRWTVAMGDDAAITVTPSPRLAADLAPGASTQREVEVLLPPGQGLMWLHVRGDERVSFSAATPVMTPSIVSMPRLPAAAGLDLAEGLDIGIVHFGTPIVSGRAAVVGEDLALDLRVADAVMRYDRESPWLGSSVELFADAEILARPQQQPKQLVLIPGGPQRPPEIRPFRCPALDATRWRIDLVAGGWHARVRWSLADLGIDPRAKRLRFDLIANVHSPVAGQNQIRIPRWGVVNDWNSSDYLAWADLR